MLIVASMIRFPMQRRSTLFIKACINLLCPDWGHCVQGHPRAALEYLSTQGVQSFDPALLSLTATDQLRTRNDSLLFSTTTIVRTRIFLDTSVPILDMQRTTPIKWFTNRFRPGSAGNIRSGPRRFARYGHCAV